VVVHEEVQSDHPQVPDLPGIADGQDSVDQARLPDLASTEVTLSEVAVADTAGADVFIADAPSADAANFDGLSVDSAGLPSLEPLSGNPFADCTYDHVRAVGPGETTVLGASAAQVGRSRAGFESPWQTVVYWQVPSQEYVVTPGYPARSKATITFNVGVGAVEYVSGHARPGRSAMCNDHIAIDTVVEIKTDDRGFDETFHATMVADKTSLYGPSRDLTGYEFQGSYRFKWSSAGQEQRTTLMSGWEWLAQQDGWLLLRLSLAHTTRTVSVPSDAGIASASGIAAGMILAAQKRLPKIDACGGCVDGNSCGADAKCSCGGVVCAAGLVCSSLGGTPACSCFPEVSPGLPDTCVSRGGVCAMDKNASTFVPASCRTPKESEVCEPSLGCETGLACVATSVSEYPWDGLSRCVRSCASASDCPSALHTCREGHCRLNVCADPDHSTDPVGERAKYQKTCATGDGAGGTCLPLPGLVPGYSDVTDVGICIQSGTLASGAECQFGAGRPDQAKMCPAMEFCDPVFEDPATTKVRGICRPICSQSASAAENGSCSNGGVCRDWAASARTLFDPAMANGLASGVHPKTRAGVCYPGCDPFASGTCSGPDALGDEQVCVYRDNDRAACMPVHPTAKGLGAACAPVTNDNRVLCKAGSYCNTSRGVCAGFCKTAECPDQGVCAHCQIGSAELICLPTDTDGNPAQGAVGRCW
jgi:hypothetical protein